MYSIGQVEEITGVKAHILRYWEEIIPGFAPQKDIGGRRIYSQRELELVMRLKFLIYEKKFTIEGARDQLIAEVDSVNDNAELVHQISELRKDLTDLYFSIKNIIEIDIAVIIKEVMQTLIKIYIFVASSLKKFYQI